MAHPLGNFTTNQLAQVRIDEGQARVHYVLDQAEIPTFQQIQRFDASGNGTIEGAERGPLLDSELAEISSGLELTADGRSLRLGPPREPKLSFPSGQGGLLLTRVEADFSAPLPRGARRVELVNRAFAGRIGWRAIQILPGERDRRHLQRSRHRSHGRPAEATRRISSPARRTTSRRASRCGRDRVRSRRRRASRAARAARIGRSTGSPIPWPAATPTAC